LLIYVAILFCTIFSPYVTCLFADFIGCVHLSFVETEGTQFVNQLDVYAWEDVVHLTNVHYLNVGENHGLDVKAPFTYSVAAGHQSDAVVDTRLGVSQDLLELWPSCY
jgi:hypothetical protein